MYYSNYKGQKSSKYGTHLTYNKTIHYRRPSSSHQGPSPRCKRRTKVKIQSKDNRTFTQEKHQQPRTNPTDESKCTKKRSRSKNKTEDQSLSSPTPDHKHYIENTSISTQNIEVCHFPRGGVVWKVTILKILSNMKSELRMAR